LAIGAGTSFGTMGIFSKLFYSHGGKPFELLLLRFAGTALLLGVFALYRRRTSPGRRIVLLAMALGSAQVGASYAVLEAFDRAPVGLVVLLFYLYPLLATIGGVLLYAEEFSPRRALVLAIGLVGIALTVGAPSSTPTIGIVLGLIAAACTAVYVLGARYVLHSSSLESIEMIAMMYAAPALGFSIAAGIRGFQTPEAAGWGWAGALILVSSALAMSLFYTAVKLVGAGTTALFATVEPLVAVVLAYLVLNESLGATQLAGGGLILGSVVLLALPTRRQRLVEEPLTVTPP